MKDHRTQCTIAGSALIALAAAFILLSQALRTEAAERPADFSKGLWVSVFTEKRIHYSVKAVDELVTFCERAGIDAIYLQVFQSGRAYYDTALCSRDKYEQMVKDAGQDTIRVLLQQAHRKGIKVYAWVNTLSIGTNRTADIVRKYGQSVLTVDQHRKNSLRAPEGEKENCYVRENQLFLEPGDPRVQEQLAGIAGEIMTRYPQFDGMHLDYIRYPASVPFTPGSRFNSVGQTYGYGIKNVERFQQKTGLDPFKPLAGNEQYLLWDDWKRQQVTGLVEKIAQRVRQASPQAVVSCAVLAVPDRAYESAFQNWPDWIEKGVVDYVVLMNYTIDTAFFRQMVTCAAALQAKGHVQIGIGAFLLKEDRQALQRQYRLTRDSGARGAVFFSWDDISAEILKAMD